ncbi:integral membrane sensor signal transduction histidine kinase [Desulfovibrio sp. X2]|uniref:sensor histidine kinase n=1 Tax=Desulfovibrio sp. X2 TaxID=941449 RepID=UPI000358DFEF|nr:ATP-binding protein [Desulfovibrio sp. X2]EPR37383.1 integral membrane sensor signal transduction histidine kinase [Desulfovibrio sp. X2]
MKQRRRAQKHFFDLRTNIVLLLIGLVAVTLAWAGATLWHVQHDAALVADLAERDAPALSAAQNLRRVLAGMDAEAAEAGPGSLTRIRTLRATFEASLEQVRNLAGQGARRELLGRIETEWQRYVYAGEQLGDPDPVERERARREAHAMAGRLDELCRVLVTGLTDDVAAAGATWQRRAHIAAVLSWIAVPVAVLLCLSLALLLFRRVLGPIRSIALKSGAEDSAQALEDEIQALGNRLADLAASVDSTHSKLVESREHLMQSEKLALVGKLAAGVAHSIRNPLTSVKMRLFSLERGLDLPPVHKEDFEVISEEIRHLDTIIRNFLEFSRRPKLKIVPVSPSDVVDMTVELLRHRLESHGVTVTVEREERLPAVEGDPDQLKEALVNLMLNSCEAMPGGGTISLVEEAGFIEPVGDVAIVTLADTGPGIPAHLREKIFQPFFSTKEEGTGLGLPIARRILEEHKGWLHLKGGDGHGAAFVMVLPSREKAGWRRS